MNTIAYRKNPENVHMRSSIENAVAGARAVMSGNTAYPSQHGLRESTIE